MKIMRRLALSIIVPMALSAQNPQDIKFYNLEKEYRQTVTYVYKVQQAKALELKQIVIDMLSIYGSLYVNDQTNELYITDVTEKIDDIKAILPGLDDAKIRAGNNLVTRMVYLQHENGSEVVNIIRHKLSGEGSVYEVPNLNALVITDVPSKINEVSDVLNLIDVPSKHISIEISIVEFNDEEFSELGINFFNWLQGLTMQADLHGEELLGAGGILSRNRGRFYIRSRTEPRLQKMEPNLETEQEKMLPYHLSAEVSVSDIIQFICDHADGHVLANTRIITRNNKEASIYAREIIPFRFFENEGSYENRYENAAIAGVSVRVRPVVQEDSLINLRVYPTISDLTGWSPKGMPIVFERSVSTEVKVKDNEVFVLGGLKKREGVEVRRGIPGLRDIPVLQWFFSASKKIVLEREVLIFIRSTTHVETSVDKAEYRKSMEQIYEKMEKSGRKKGN